LNNLVTFSGENKNLRNDIPINISLETEEREIGHDKSMCRFNHLQKKEAENIQIAEVMLLRCSEQIEAIDNCEYLDIYIRIDSDSRKDY